MCTSFTENKLSSFAESKSKSHFHYSLQARVEERTVTKQNGKKSKIEKESNSHQWCDSRGRYPLGHAVSCERILSALDVRRAVPRLRATEIALSNDVFADFNRLFGAVYPLQKI